MKQIAWIKDCIQLHVSITWTQEIVVNVLNYEKIIVNVFLFIYVNYSQY